MNTTTPHPRLRSRTLLALLTAFAFAACGLGAQPAAAIPGALSYGWPVKPFEKPHPVRGSFGDPRTMFTGPPTRATLLRGPGRFSFHFGVDVSAPNGTAVYPVVSGVVTHVAPDRVDVGSGSRSFQYWHIAPTVRLGLRVEARRTVLGHILRPCGHVHLTEVDSGVIVNPLSPGHLGPYTDTSLPTIDAVGFRRADTENALGPARVGGRVELFAAAHDMPSMQVRGTWRDLPVTPSLLEWRIMAAATGNVVAPTRVVYDVRRLLPAPSMFWRIYARGTHQNMTVFGKHYSYRQPGTYLFRLTPDGFDTRSLHDGAYKLIVTATDLGGNSNSRVSRFTVDNTV